MRFFKYLVFIFLSLISLDVLAAYKIVLTSKGWDSNKTFNTASDACNSYISTYNSNVENGRLVYKNNTETTCVVDGYSGDTKAYTDYILPISQTNCPAKGYWKLLYLPSGTTSLPLRQCIDGCTWTGSGMSIETPNYTQTVITATGDSENCTNQNTDSPPPKCDTKNPYGDCYVPPNDNCVRLKDGSIQCPNQQQPPIQQGCENGATYCKRPPQGCGPDYVSGSFNGEQICVKKGPNTPTDPKDPDDPSNPNSCTTSYCPKPDKNKDCPNGYYPTTYQGQNICVKDNPDPNKPNPNDPNNSGSGDDGSGSSEPTGGDGDGSSGGSVNLKPVVDSINALKAALLSAIEGVSKKLTSLIDGQKKSNDHLKNIKDESVKSNEKLDKTNEHLDKIEEATQAASTGIGETNKKLDQIFSDQGKEQIEQLGEQSTDTRLTSAESEMTSKLQSLANTLSYSSSHACISDFTITDIPYFGSTTVPFSKYCDLLALIKLLLKLATLMYALRMIDATVRVF